MNWNQYSQVYEDLGIAVDTLGCVMLDLKPLENMYSIELDGASVALYQSKNKKRFWINGWVADKKPHVTLLYGLLSKHYKKHIDVVLSDWSCDQVIVDHVDYFPSPYSDENYYCIVAHIKTTPELLEGHRRLSLLPHINTFFDYKPHMTIAYINAEQGPAYRDKLIVQFNKLLQDKPIETVAIST
jgi:2'-5' RNA ligase